MQSSFAHLFRLHMLIGHIDEMQELMNQQTTPVLNALSAPSTTTRIEVLPNSSEPKMPAQLDQRLTSLEQQVSLLLPPYYRKCSVQKSFSLDIRGKVNRFIELGILIYNPRYFMPRIERSGANCFTIVHPSVCKNLTWKLNIFPLLLN